MMARVVAKGTGEKEIYLQIHPLPSGSCHTRVFIAPRAPACARNPRGVLSRGMVSRTRCARTTALAGGSARHGVWSSLEQVKSETRPK